MRTALASTEVRFALFVAACALAFEACSSEQDYPAGVEATSDVGAGGGRGSSSVSGAGGAGSAAVVARFALPASGAPSFLDVPFPSDLYLDKGRIADVPGLSGYVKSGASFLVAGFSTLDGFGTTAGAIFEIDDTAAAGATPANPVAAVIDPASLPATEKDSTAPAASAMLVDLEAKSPALALVPARVDYHDDTAIGSTTRPLLVVLPARGVVLAGGHHYAAVLTSAVKTKDGRGIQPSEGFLALRDGKRSTAAEMLYGDAVDKVASLVPALADKKSIAALAVYTTQTTAQELIDLRASFAKAKAPALSWQASDLAPMGAGLFSRAPLPAGYTATLDAWLGAPVQLPDKTDDPADDQQTGLAHDSIAAVGTAVLNAPNLLIEDAMQGYNNPLHHTFARDASGKPIPNPAQPTAKVWMTIALPTAPVPPAGFPVVVVQHGIGGDRSILLSIADTFAKKGWATVAIESVTFGARAGTPTYTTDAHAIFPWTKSPGAYDGPDGFVDQPNGATDFFGNLKSLGALRDQMRQSILDICAAVDTLKDPAIDLGPLLLAVPGAKLDPMKIAYLGNSLGGLMGSMVGSIDPGIQTFLLNVAGGGLMTELGANSASLSSSINLAASFNFGFKKGRFVPAHPLLQLLQHIIDAADPLVYARHLVSAPLVVNGSPSLPKNVIQIEALWDEVVPNEANEALARAAGLPLAEPSAGPRAGVPLTSVMPAGGVISGVPIAGTTAVLVQASPATHSSDLFSKQGTHHFAHPYPQFDKSVPFPPLATSFALDQPYLPLQGMMTDFFDSAFAGGAPVVKGFPAPVLDFDGDGVTDDKDADPNDPTKK